MQDTLPALEGTTRSEVFSQHLNALHATRKAFIQSEAEERIRRALRNKVRASEQVFMNGDRVFYKREGKERWLGPGKVVFQDGKVVFVRHGGDFIRVSPNRLQKVNSYSTDDDVDNDTSSKIEDNVDALKEVIENRELHPISEYIPTKELHNDENQDKQQNRKTPKMNDIIQYKRCD